MIEPVRYCPSGEMSMSNRSLPNGSTSTSRMRSQVSYGGAMRTSVDMPLWWRTPHSDLSPRLNARSPTRGFLSSSRLFPVSTLTVWMSRHCFELLVVKKIVPLSGS